VSKAASVMFCDSGSSAVEFGLTVSVFMSMLFGIVNIAIVLWTLASLHYAGQTAARCAAVGSTGCTSATAVQTYALSQYFGGPLAGTNPFVYSATGCGHTVTASYNYSLVIPLIGTYSLPLSATACSP
jgi:hypothetical protein